MTDKIFTTTNYDIFELHSLNRRVQPRSKNFKDLVESIKRDGFRRGYPIEVYKNGGSRMKVISGHNRLMAAKEAGVPVKYVFAEKEYSPAQGEVGPGKWKLSEYFECYCQQGVPEYLEIEQYMEKTGISLNNAASMFHGNSAGSGNHASDGTFKNGTFEIKDRNHAHLVGSIVVYLRTIGIDFAAHNNLVKAISHAVQVPGFDVSRFKQKSKAHKELFEKQKNFDNYLDMIELIYNRQCQKTDKIPLAFLSRQGAKERNIIYKQSNR
jgi:hypothetical protein